MSGANKQRILSEIRRTAEANGGVPLGIKRFLRETGIKVSDWHGKIWARWGDALEEAGLQPNELQAAYSDDALIEKFADLIRSLGHYPVAAELRMKARSDDSFPSHNTFARFGGKRQFAARIIDYCKSRSGYEGVAALCAPIAVSRDQQDDNSPNDNGLPVDPSSPVKAGYVYMALLKLGREKRYKIGKAILVERRKDQISIQLPEALPLRGSQVDGRLVSGSLGRAPPSGPAPLAPRCAATGLDRGARPRGWQ